MDARLHSRRRIHGTRNGAYAEDPNSVFEQSRHYHQLYRAALQENWQETVAIFRRCHEQAATEARKCALHFAMKTGKANSYLKHLLDDMEIEDMKSEQNGETAISIAATVGNVEVMKMLVEKDENAGDEWTTVEKWPLNIAARYGNAEIVSYLLNVPTTRSPSRDELANLLENLIQSRLYGAAVQVVQYYSISRRSTSDPAMCYFLSLLANQPFAFKSTCSLGRFQQLQYYSITATLDDHIHKIQICTKYLLSKIIPRDVRTVIGKLVDHINKFQIFIKKFLPKNIIHRGIQLFISNAEHIFSSLKEWWFDNMTLFQYAMEVSWKMIKKLVGWLLKEVEETKVVHDQAKELVKSLCKLLKDENEDEDNFTEQFKEPFLLAAENGIVEIVQPILEVCPSAIDFTLGEDNILVFAVKRRNHDILGLEEYMDNFKDMAKNFSDKDTGNNILHVAGKLAPKDKLNSIGSPALQLKSELKWFKRVRALVPDTYSGNKNKEGKLPVMVFQDEHKDLRADGEKWMETVGESCINIASLIVIFVFLSKIILSRLEIVSDDDHCHTILPEDGIAKVAVLGLAMAIFCVALVMVRATLRFIYYDVIRRTRLLRLFFALGALCLSIFLSMIASIGTLYVVVGNVFKILIVLILAGVISGLAAMIGRLID